MRGFVTFILAGLAFIVMSSLIEGSILVSAGVAVAVFVLGRFALPGVWRKKDKLSDGSKGRSKSAAEQVREEFKIDVTAFGIDQEEFDSALREGSRKLAVLNAAVGKIGDQKVRATGQAICDLVARILSDIRQDPKDLRPARKFLNYYLDSTVKVVEQYVHLSSRGTRSADVRQTLERVEQSLETIRSAYQKQLDQLLQNDVMDLDAELKVLEKAIEMEGLGGDG